MVKLTVVRTNTKPNTNLATHRASATEGEAARRLLETQGFTMKRKANGQYEFPCPFHEGPGSIERGKSANFYMNVTTSEYFCQSASCGERGNLQLLERFFGIDQDDDYAVAYRDRESRLKEYERNLTSALRKPFYEHGLTDQTIERFRLGYEPEHVETKEIDGEKRTFTIPGRYVIPYLEGRRPRFFRYYNPDGDPKYKYTWEEGAESRLYNAQDAMGDKDGIVFLCYTPDTEVLTQRGWVAFPDLTDSDRVAQYHQDSGEIEFVLPAERQVFEYDGPMVSISGRHADLLVTPDHRVLSRVQNGLWRTKPARDLIGRQGLHFPVAGLARGGRDVSTDEARLLMAWIADGCQMQQGTRVYWNLKKDRKRERLHMLLDRLEIAYEEVEYPSHPGWHQTWVSRDALESRAFDTRSKVISRVVLEWREDARRAFLDEARFWDGDGHAEASRFFTGIRANADLMSELAAISGYGCVVRTDAREGRNDTYIVGLNARPVRRLANGVQEAERYTGKVYCVSVPSTYIVVRRNGRTMVSGNCEGEQKAMLLVQMGYAAVAVPGASQWRDEFQAAFTHAKKVIVVYDNDNPLFHNYDKPEHDQVCRKCAGKGLDRCTGHNPGQEAALRRVEQIGWRAKNVVLPLPDDSVKKTDINDYIMRDGHTNADFAELATGKPSTPFQVQTLAQIVESPPEEAEFLVENGILSKGGRLLIAGKPKVGKSIFVDNLALSLSSGIPFLKGGTFKGFAIDHPTRTLLLDRELSKWSLFKRLTQLADDRPGFKAAYENLLIDHDHLIRLDQANAYDTLLGLVEHNGAEVVILDTAYKFFGGDVESSSSIMKGFEVLDKIIHQTGCSFILTHHHKKTQGGSGNKQNVDYADPDNVAGSFLWTGWPNATILLNYLNRSVENPFNSVATFTAFRDSAPPEPLALYRNRESISYASVEVYSHEDSDLNSSSARVNVVKPSTDAVEQLLLEVTPVTEDEFLHIACGKFGVSQQTMKPYYIDALARGNFEKTKTNPPILKHIYEEETETWEAEHGLPERPIPSNAGAGLEDDTMPMFDAAGVISE